MNKPHGNKTHSATVGDKESKEYVCWLAMKSRCNNPNNNRYNLYGGRGIKVCERWNKSYEKFRLDMGSCPNGYTLDRIDFNADYEPLNCRWATQKQQQNNRRNNRRITFRGITRTSAQWAAKLGFNVTTIHGRINRLGWTIERTLTTPLNTLK